MAPARVTAFWYRNCFSGWWRLVVVDFRPVPPDTMTAIVVIMTVTTALLAAAAATLSLIRALNTATAGEVLEMELINDREREDQIELELTVATGARAVTIERIILERDFAARVLAQAPRGFRERHPAPPPNYAAFEPDLSELADKKRVSRRVLDEEKRRQHTELVNGWADLCENVMTWQGRARVRRSETTRMVIPMRTDVAATGRITLIYSYRIGLIRTTSTTTTDYRPRLMAVTA